MPYRLSISRQVHRHIDRLPGNVRQRVRRTIAQLALDPRPEDAKEMVDDLTGFYRLRVDVYRIIYTIDEDEVLVEVIRVAQRTSSTYEGLV